MSHGKICYLEIPAKTGQASADFYSSILPCMGAFALFADPVGNEFGLYKEPNP